MQPTFTKAVGETLGADLSGLESASLRLDKFTFLSGAADNKRIQLEAVCRVAAARDRNERPSPPPADMDFVASLGARLMVDMAGGALENAGLCLHRHFNCPMIPGSAVKGIARHAAWCEWKRLDEAEKTEAADALARLIAQVFGFPTGDEMLDNALDGRKRDANAGSIAFLHALPADDGWQLVCDVLAPHGGNDYTNPIPSPFLAVDKGSSFRFALNKTRRACDGHIEAAVRWLKSGLSNAGAGAKTAAGYGWFDTGTDRVAAETVELVLATPGFLGGASHERPEHTELRVSSLRGLLRFWWRTLYRDLLNPTQLKALEALLWGAADKEHHCASLITLKIVSETNARVELFDYKDRFNPKRLFAQDHNIAQPPRMTTPGIFYQSYGMCDGDKKRHFVHPGARWRLSIAARNDQEHYALKNGERSVRIPRDAVILQARAALSLLCTYGGIGSKSRKGFGSLHWANAMSLQACRQAADALLLEIGLHDQPAPSVPYSLGTAVQQEIAVPWTDSWTVLDRLGLACQAFAQRYKHDPIKAALGLPRKIHGPRREPMSHQRNRHDPPRNLDEPNLRAARNGRKTRFASPVHYHIAPTANGMLVRMTAFPSGNIVDMEESRRMLDELSETVQSELRRLAAEPLATNVAPRRETRHANRSDRPRTSSQEIPDSLPGGLRAGDSMQAVLLDEKTKKGGWIVQGGEKKGPVVNSGEIPSHAKPGDTVTVKINSASPQGTSFRWMDGPA
jgi:CRISPR-associated protein Cmr6